MGAAPGDNRARELGPAAWPLAAFVAWSGLSILWTQDLRQGSIDLLFFYLPFGLLAIVLARLAWSRLIAIGLLVELTAMALVFSAIGIYQYETRDVFWNPKLLVSNAFAPFYRVNSVFWDPSIYGRFLVVAILALLVAALSSRATCACCSGRRPRSPRSGPGSTSRTRSRASPRSPPGSCWRPCSRGAGAG